MSPAGPREWDAVTYDRVSTPQLKWAAGVLERLGLRGDETVLDAGCGSGRVTELLLDALPEGRVIAVDGSQAMIDAARERLGGRAELICSDLLDLDPALDVDAVFSNAVFHWIPDHRSLFERLAAVLRPGGRLEAQCGGAGNVAAFKAVAERLTARGRWAPHFAGWERPWRFATPAETESLLRAAGFTSIACGLETRPEPIDDVRAYVGSVCAGPYLERLPEPQRDEFLAELVSELGRPLVLDYVRLNISARRG